jgi:hypothetical protein
MRAFKYNNSLKWVMWSILVKIIRGIKHLLKMEDPINSFKEDFLAIKKLGSIKENNNHLADYKGILELKSSRYLSESMVTLFTKSPLPKGTNTLFRRNFGYPHPKFNLRQLFSTFSGLNFNVPQQAYVCNFSFKLEIDRQQKKIFIRVKDRKTGKEIPVTAYYNFDDLKVGVNKCKYIAIIYAKPKLVSGKEFFHFDKATILSGLNFDKFLDFIEKGLIWYDFRLGAYESGKLLGKPHDHGSGFRIKKQDIPKVFVVDEI